MENHVFPRFIPEIKTIDDAKPLLKKSAGRPSEDIRVRTLAYGLSCFFYDNKVIETRTSRRLLAFLGGLLKKMDIRCNNGNYPDKKKLEDVIQNSFAAQEKPRFYTQDDGEECSWEEANNPSPDDILNWLETPEVIFKQASK